MTDPASTAPGPVFPDKPIHPDQSEGRTAVYPGSFDPITLGHLDIVERSSRLFTQVIVALSDGSFSKKYAFSTEERQRMLELATAKLPNVEVRPFSGLLTQFANQVGARVLIRGLRAITDFEYEFQMAAMNSTLAPDVETVFLMTSTRYSYLSSSIVKEIAIHGGPIKFFVPPIVHDSVVERLAPKGERASPV